MPRAMDRQRPAPSWGSGVRADSPRKATSKTRGRSPGGMPRTSASGPDRVHQGHGRVCPRRTARARAGGPGPRLDLSGSTYDWLMGIQDVTGWIFIVGGAANAGRAVRQLIRARRSEAPADPIAAGVWSGLALGLGSLITGILDVSDPRFPHRTWLLWIAAALLVAGLMTLTAEWIVSRRRARLLGPRAADGPGPGPAIAPDARTAGLIERITNIRFGTVRLAPGYDEEEVDVFLDQLVAVLSQDGQLDHSQLHNARFSTTRIRPGYAIPDVDTFLAEVAHAAW